MPWLISTLCVNEYAPPFSLFNQSDQGHMDPLAFLIGDDHDVGGGDVGDEKDHHCGNSEGNLLIVYLRSWVEEF